MEKTDFEKIVKYMGYNSEVEVIHPTVDMAYMAIKLGEVSTTFNIFNLKEMSRKDALKKGKSLLENHFKLHPVLCAGNISYVVKLFLLETDNLYDYNEMAAKLVSPYNIPVSFVNKGLFYGVLKHRRFLFDDEEYLKKAQIVLKGIVLSKMVTNFTPVGYCHELMHTALLREKGVVENYLDAEVLTIFTEFICALDSDSSGHLLTCILVNRMDNIVGNVMKLLENDFNYNFEEYVCSQYFASSVKAFNLLNIYLNANNNVKKEMLRNIQMIIDGKKGLNEMLEKYDVNFENSADSNLILKVVKDVSNI